MSNEHKAALAEGREQSRAVRNYLQALASERPKRGRKRTPESIRKRLDQVHELIPDADPLKRLQLIQERMDLDAELEAKETTRDLSSLEAGFVASAKPYSERKGITYAAWRELGIEADTLKQAGITRGS